MIDGLTLRVVIMSRSRPTSMTSHRLFPAATILVPESQRADYARTVGDSERLETIPDEVRGISRVRNWILRHYTEHAIVMADDDIKGCVSLVALRRKRLLPEEIMAMLENTAYCAAGAGAGIFGWHQRADPRLLARNNPIAFTHWVGGVLGVVGREPRWDELLTCKCDIDACLREFLERRIVWQDSRFCFEQERDTNLGGNSLFRTEERIRAERRYLKSKWKGHIVFEEYKSQDRVSIRVDRKQAISLS
jgi:hypothetical protein